VLPGRKPGAEKNRHIAAGRKADEIGAARSALRVLDGDEAGASPRLHLRDEKGAVLRAPAVHPNLRERGPDRAHHDQVPARLAAGAVQAKHAAVRARQEVGSDRGGDRSFACEGLGLRLVEQRQRTDDDGRERRRLAVIGNIDALSGRLILLRTTMKRVALGVHEAAGDLQAMATAWMNAEAAVLMMDTQAGRRIGRRIALIAKPLAHRRDRLRDRKAALELLGANEQRHADLRSIVGRTLSWDALSAVC